MCSSGPYEPAEETESLGTIHAALDAGVTQLDTGDVFGMGHNELLLRQALRDHDRAEVVISTDSGDAVIDGRDGLRG